MLMAMMMNSGGAGICQPANFTRKIATVRHRRGFLPQIRRPSTLLGSQSRAHAAAGTQ
jgi:hypothetical protein